MKRKILIVALGFLASTTMLSAENWKPRDYSRYNYKNFTEIKALQRKISDKNPDTALLNAAIFYETNRQRVLNGRKPFRYSSALEKAAQGHSRDMAKYNFYSHKSPVKGKRTPGMRMKQEGIPRAYTAENIHIGIVMNFIAGKPFRVKKDGYYYGKKKIENRTYLQLAKKMVKDWMKSPGHRRNILNPRLKYLGCGTYPFRYRSKWSAFKATQNFAGKVR
jgi:uncharacterized protein YkwD